MNFYVDSGGAILGVDPEKTQSDLSERSRRT